MIKNFKYVGIGILSIALLSPSLVRAADSPWTCSSSGSCSYRDNDGRVHYSDGSVSQPNTVWFDSSGKAVYAANSAGPADKTGQYAYQQPRLDDSNIPPPPTPVIAPPTNTGGAVFGGTVTGLHQPSTPTPTKTVTPPAWTGTDSSVWAWSEGLQAYYYRDNDGRVHYSDGSVSKPETAWTDSTGKWVYSANSKGPADTTGQHAYQAKAIDDSNIGPPPAPPAGAGTAVNGNGGAVFGPSRTVNVTEKTMAQAAVAASHKITNSGKVASADGTATVPPWQSQ